MQTSIVITVVGPDQPGLVESLSRTIKTQGGNWTHSRMAHLAGQFAGMLQVEIAAEDAEKLVAALGELEARGLSVTTVVDPGSASTEETPLAQALLEVVGQDRPGIVQAVSEALATRGVNVESLSTECQSAPWSGEPIFRAEARIQLPADLDPDRLRVDLEALAPDLGVDLGLEATSES